MYLPAPDADLSLGRLHFRIGYDSKLFDLTVHLIEGIYSAPAIRCNTNNHPDSIIAFPFLQRTTFARSTRAVSVIRSFGYCSPPKWTIANAKRPFYAANRIRISTSNSAFPFRETSCRARSWCCRCWTAIVTRTTILSARFAFASTNWICPNRLR